MFRRSGSSAVRVCIALAAACAAACGSHAGQPAGSAFASGQTLHIIVASDRGTRADSYARLTARALAGVLGVNSVQVENIAAVDGLVAAKQLATTAPRDGLTIGVVAAHNLDAAPEGAGGFALLASPAPLLPVCAFTAASGIGSFEQWRAARHSLRLGVGTPDSVSFTAAALLHGAAGLPATLVPFATIGHDWVAALTRGDLDGICTDWDQLAPLVETEPHLRPVLRLADDITPGVDVPDANDLNIPEQAKALLHAGIYQRNAFGVVFVAPPGVAADRVEVLRQSLLRAFGNPELQREAKVEAAGLRVAPVSGADLDRDRTESRAQSSELAAVHALVAQVEQ